jgi:predicted phosphodiesterase
MSAKKQIDWASVDWAKSNPQIAKALGLHRGTVHKMRPRYEGKAKKPTAIVDPLMLLASQAKARKAPAKPAPSAKKAARVPLIMWASDVHFPEEDPHAWACFLARVADAQPSEIILGGDILEMESASSHGGVARPASLVEEIEYARAKLTELRGLVPDARITFLEGNHEQRLQRTVVKMLPTFEGSLALRDLLGLGELDIEWHPYGQTVHRGRLGFTHGWWTPLHHAAKHIRECSTSVMYGHSHRPQSFHIGSGTGHVRGAYGMPCLRTLDAEWCNGRPHGWAHGWGEVYVDEASGRYNAYTVIVVDGCAIVDGKQYSGRRSTGGKAA